MVFVKYVIMKRYIIAVPGNKYVDIDNHSGGYPYLVDSPGRAHVWTNPEKAEKYLGMFNKTETYGLDLKHSFLCTIEYIVKPV